MSRHKLLHFSIVVEFSQLYRGSMGVIAESQEVQVSGVTMCPHRQSGAMGLWACLDYYWTCMEM